MVTTHSIAMRFPESKQSAGARQKIPARGGVMFASGIRLKGLELLAKYRIREGMGLCLKVMGIGTWGMRARITSCLKILRSYGGAAKAVLPQLRQLERELKNRHDAKSLKTHIDMVSKLIADVEAAKDTPELRSLNLP